MRTVIGFFSLLAFGVLAAGVLTVVGTGSMPGLSLEAAAGETAGIHLGSLLIGLVLGVVLSALARVSWSQLPGRAAHWLVLNERTIYRLALVSILIGVLVYY
jgi:hypothetical protein